LAYAPGRRGVRVFEEFESVFDDVVIGGAQAGCGVKAGHTEDPDVCAILIETGDENRYEPWHSSIGANAMFETEANKGDSKMASISYRMSNRKLPEWFVDDLGPLGVPYGKPEDYAVPPAESDGVLFTDKQIMKGDNVQEIGCSAYRIRSGCREQMVEERHPRSPNSSRLIHLLASKDEAALPQGRANENVHLF
jgi:hypothetical protein